MRHGCIVMASGMGTRFGSNKLLAPLGGMPLLQHVLNATEGLFAKRVVVTRHAEVARLCDTLGVDVVLHDEPRRNDTVRLGIERLAGCDTATFVQGDQPLITPESIRALVNGAESSPECIWRVGHNGTLGAPVLFPAWSFDELLALPSGKGGGFVAKAHAHLVRTVEVASEWELLDVDTVEDLEKVRAYTQR